MENWKIGKSKITKYDNMMGGWCSIGGYFEKGLVW